MWGSAQSDRGVCFFSRIFHELFNVLLCGRLYGVVRAWFGVVWWCGVVRAWCGSFCAVGGGGGGWLV